MVEKAENLRALNEDGIFVLSVAMENAAGETVARMSVEYHLREIS